MESAVGFRARAAHTQHVRSGARWFIPRLVHPGRGLRAVRSEHSACHGSAFGHGMHRHSRHLSQRNGAICACVPAGVFISGERRHIYERRAPHFARTQNHRTIGGFGRLGGHCRPVECARISHELHAPVADHGRNCRAHAHVPGRELREAGRARLHPVALQRSARRPVRRPCTWARSCAAKESST